MSSTPKSSFDEALGFHNKLPTTAPWLASPSPSVMGTHAWQHDNCGAGFRDTNGYFDLNSHQPFLHIVLYQPEIAPNTGAVGRTCVALGARLWLVRPLGFRIDEKRLRRAGLDYWERLDLRIVDHWEQLQSELRPPEWWYFTKLANRSLHAIEFQPGAALVFGCETNGLPESLTTSNPEALVRIPTTDQVRSLNLSCAVAVAAYEAARQLAFAGQPPQP